MISTVLDTNILASGIVNTQNTPGQILNAWREGQFMLVTSEQIIKELQHVFQKPYFQKYINADQFSAFVTLLRNEALVTSITTKVQGIATHPADDLILATAVSAHANYLVTGDGPMLRKVCSSYKGVTLLTPNEFLKRLESASH